MKSGLPEMARTAFSDIQGLSVTPIDASEEDCERVHSLRDEDKVDVVGHEAVGEDANSGILEVLMDQPKV